MKIITPNVINVSASIISCECTLDDIIEDLAGGKYPITADNINAILSEIDYQKLKDAIAATIWDHIYEARERAEKQNKLIK